MIKHKWLIFSFYEFLALLKTLLTRSLEVQSPSISLNACLHNIHHHYKLYRRSFSMRGEKFLRGSGFHALVIALLVIIIVYNIIKWHNIYQLYQRRIYPMINWSGFGNNQSFLPPLPASSHHLLGPVTFLTQLSVQRNALERKVAQLFSWKLVTGSPQLYDCLWRRPDTLCVY